MGCINVCLERKGRGGCGVKLVLGICLAEQRGKSVETVELVLAFGLFWLNDDCCMYVCM